jgi:hypothetical protein
LLLLLLTLLSFFTSTISAMTWAKTWENILQGGPTRWKVDDLEVKKKALGYIIEYTKSTNPLRILCPLAGDDPFVQYAWSQGHDVTAIDLVPAAVEGMRQQFGGSESDWTRSMEGESTVVWNHASGRATLYQGDMLAKRPELTAKFDAIYDKDSFGALDLDMRKPFCQRLSEYCQDDAIVYIEVKNKASGKESGPPYHVEKENLMQATSFGIDNFQHVASLGEVYPIGMPGMTQTGHILKRLNRV